MNRRERIKMEYRDDVEVLERAEDVFNEGFQIIKDGDVDEVGVVLTVMLRREPMTSMVYGQAVQCIAGALVALEHSVTAGGGSIGIAEDEETGALTLYIAKPGALLPRKAVASTMSEYMDSEGSIPLTGKPNTSSSPIVRPRGQSAQALALEALVEELVKKVRF